MKKMTNHRWLRPIIAFVLLAWLAGCQSAWRTIAPCPAELPCPAEMSARFPHEQSPCEPTDQPQPTLAQPTTADPALVSNVSFNPGELPEVQVALQQDEQSEIELLPPAAGAADDATERGEQGEQGGQGEQRGSDQLQLREVILSVQQSYPLLVSAMLERDVADGKQLAASGEFDLNVKAYGTAAPMGFYKNYRNGVALDQPLFSGGYVYGGYKIGNGEFQPWFKERETDEAGEFSAGIGVPLLKDRTIDTRRAELFQASLARDAVEPVVRMQMLEFVRIAARVYWSWVAAGRSLEAQRELLRNAQARVRQIEERVNADDLPQIARINNEQLIAARETKVIEAQRKLQEAAIKLSLFVRDGRGEPIVPDDSQLPTEFPQHQSLGSDQPNADIAMALAASPALIELNLLSEQVRVELQNAENMLLPKLDARLLTSKDIGQPASSKRDKTPFELEAGLYGEVPLQRRKARGKITSAQGKLAQIDAKREFVVNKIGAAVRDARSALQAAAGRIERAGTNLRLARQTLELGRIQFDAGDIDLVDLNIYEKAVTDAQLLLISAQADFFSALADYRAILAIDPLQPLPAIDDDRDR